MIRALAVVSRLLEAEDPDIDAEDFVSRCADRWQLDGVQLKVNKLPGAVRRTGEGYEDQWYFHYKNWLFVVSTYDDGTQIWSAFYKTPAFKSDTPAIREQGWKWDGGGMPKRLPAGYDPAVYLQKLQRMADDHPDVWRRGYIPDMPAGD